MTLWRLLVLCKAFVVWAQRVPAEFMQSPCPGVFEYQYDNTQNLVGVIYVPAPGINDDKVVLDLQMSVGNPVQGFNGHVSVATSSSEVIGDILDGKPIKYTVLFPYWRKYPPRVTKIAVNGVPICQGSPIERHLVEHLTTVTLQHTLTINIPPSMKNRLNRPGQFLTDKQPSGGFGMQIGANPFNPNLNQNQGWNSFGNSAQNNNQQFNGPDALSVFYFDGQNQKKNDGGGFGGGAFFNVGNVNPGGLGQNGFFFNNNNNNNQGGNSFFNNQPAVNPSNNPFVNMFNLSNGGTNPFLNAFGSNPNNNSGFDTKVGSEATTKRPVDATTMRPMDPTTERPVDPTTKKPMDASTKRPMDATTMKPMDASTKRPMDATTMKPMDATTKSPVVATTKKQPADDTCGVVTKINTLILGGHTLEAGDHPWLGALFRQQNEGLRFSCGSTLVSKKHVVTAAHCIQTNTKRYTSAQLWVVLGRTNIQQWSYHDGAQIIQVESTHVHPDYRFSNADADIAVLRLSEDAIYSNLIRRACIWSGPTSLKTIVGMTGIIAGWGKDKSGSVTLRAPKEISLPVVSEEDCLRSNDAFGILTSNRTFCAGHKNDSGPCNGDSGGGFFMDVGGKMTLRGVVSLSLVDEHKKCNLREYVMFTDVAQHLQWLWSMIR